MPESLEEIKENVRAANDIVDVIGEYAAVKRAGSTFKALCPFHKEKTPSFVISQQRQSYHCFGCGVGGDVFKFVMEQEGVDFMTSMRMLAERAGITIHFSGERPEERSDKDALHNIHEGLADFYQRVLSDHDSGRNAREYLQRREIGADAVEAFRIGFAPNGNTVMRWGRQNKFSREELIKAGVLVEREGDCYDRFRGRIMFPICDALGRVIGFSGRVLDSEQSPAKYLNSPETLLFKKSRVLYGFHRARKSMTDLRQAIVCEGQLDCIRCHLAGFENAVAPQGTALTDQQARMIKRQADSAVLLFDPDEAGGKAAVRSAEIMLEQSLNVSIAVLPAGSDPDTLIREQGGDALRALIAAARSPVSYLIERLAAREDMGSHTGVVRVAREVLALIAHSDSAIQRDRYIGEAAGLLKVSETALLEDLAAAEPARPARRAPAPAPRKKYPPDQLMLLGYLHNNPELRAAAAEFLTPDVFTSAPCRAIFMHLLNEKDSHAKGIARTLKSRDEETIQLAARIDNSPPPANDPDYPLEDLFFELILRLMHKHFKNMREQLKKKPLKTEAEDRLQGDLTNWMANINRFIGSREWPVARRFLKTVCSRCLTNI